MQISLPASWGPATVLSVLVVLVGAIGGLVLVFQGTMSFEEWLDTLPKLGAIAVGLGVARSIAMGGPGTGFGSGPDSEVRK